MRKTVARYVIVAILLVALAAGFTSCGSDTSANLCANEHAGQLPAFSLVATDLQGTELPTAAAKLVTMANGFALYAQSTKAVGFTVEFDTEQWHVARVERGSYFGPNDLFLAVADYPGLAAFGGYHFDPALIPAGGALVARVYLAPGMSLRSSSKLPTDDNARAREFTHEEGDTTVTFAWRYHNLGDYNQDGETNISDITPVGVHFGAVSGGAGWLAASLADGDGNGEVNIGDLTPIGQNYLTQITGYYLEQGTSDQGPWTAATSILLSEGVASPWLVFSVDVDEPADGDWYRVRTYHDSDSSQGVTTAALQLDLLPPGEERPDAYAYCMPNQGWAPLTVYFSTFGSTDDGAITKIEWDLDGDGSFETDATTTGGYTSHTYSAAGLYAAVLRLTDDKGYTSTATCQVEVRDPALSSVDYWTVFDDSQVRRIQIDIDQANWDEMWLVPEDKVEVEADVDIFGELYESIALSMRGHRSLWDVPEKKPWQIDFNDYDDTQTYHNLKQLLFNNFYMDPSMTREKLAYDMLQFAGVCASHVCYVEFWFDIHGDGVPSIFWGVYSMVERVDKKFLANRYGEENKGGNLYKAAAWVEGGANLEYLGSNIEDYPTPHGEPCYGKRTNEDEADYSDVINLCYVIDGVDYESPGQFAQALEQVFNVDSFLRYMACVLSCSNLDIYIYTGNNYYLYNNPGTSKFEWIPWDVNDSWGLFMDQEMNRSQPLYDWGGQPLARQVMEVERYRQTYAAYVDLLRRNFFTYSNIRSSAQAWRDLLSAKVKQDTGDKMYYGESAQFPVTAFDTNWDTDWEGTFGVASLTQIRCDYIDEHLLTDL